MLKTTAWESNFLLQHFNFTPIWQKIIILNIRMYKTKREIWVNESQFEGLLHQSLRVWTLKRLSRFSSTEEAWKLGQKHPVNYETVPVYTVTTKQSPEARRLPQGKDNRASFVTQFHILQYSN